MGVSFAFSRLSKQLQEQPNYNFWAKLKRVFVFHRKIWVPAHLGLSNNLAVNPRAFPCRRENQIMYSDIHFLVFGALVVTYLIWLCLNWIERWYCSSCTLQWFCIISSHSATSHDQNDIYRYFCGRTVGKQKIARKLSKRVAQRKNPPAYSEAFQCGTKYLKAFDNLKIKESKKHFYWAKWKYFVVCPSYLKRGDVPRELL